MSKPKIDVNASYEVTLAQAIQVGRRLVHPGPRVVLRGDVLKGAPEGTVIDYKLVAE